MAKIMIYEDNPGALEERYSSLTKNYEVSFFLMGSEDAISGAFSDYFIEKGFRPIELSKEYLGNWSSIIPEADIYFVDGLIGGCFEVLRNLPSEKSYINSHEFVIRYWALKKGYNLVDKDLDQIIMGTLARK